MEKQIKKIIYTAIVFEKDPFSRTFEKQIGVDKYINHYCHHVTVKFGFPDTVLPEYIGEYAEFEILEIRRDENAIAGFGRVTIGPNSLREALKDVNQHITIATAENIKPVYCKDMEGKTVHVYQWPYFQAYGRCGAFCVFNDDSTGWVFEK